MYWNIFDKNRYELLKRISEVVNIDDYYMICKYNYGVKLF